MRVVSRRHRHGRPRKRRERVERAAQLAAAPARRSRTSGRLFASAGPDSASSRASGTRAPGPLQCRSRSRPSLRPECAARRGRAPASGPAPRARDAMARSVAAVFGDPLLDVRRRGSASAPRHRGGGADQAPQRGLVAHQLLGQRGGLGERRVEVAEAPRWPAAPCPRRRARRSAAGPGGRLRVAGSRPLSTASRSTIARVRSSGITPPSGISGAPGGPGPQHHEAVGHARQAAGADLRPGAARAAARRRRRRSPSRPPPGRRR